MNKKLGIFVEETNLFNQIFFPLANKMFSVLRQANFNVTLSPNTQSFDGTKIIFGAHSNPNFWAKNVNSHDIFVNFEPVYLNSWAEKNNCYCKLLREHTVVDYSPRNKPHCGDAVILPVPPQFDHCPEKHKQHNILFVGNPTRHRKIKLAEIMKQDVKVAFGFRLFGDQLVTEISKSKIFLSINDENQDMINLFRFSLCSNSNTLFVGEAGNLEENADFSELMNISIFRNMQDLIIGLQKLLTSEKNLKNAVKKQNDLAFHHEKLFSNNLISFLENN